MANFYDRDPYAMLRYSAEAYQLIEEMSGIVQRVSNALTENASNLDDASQRDIEKLKTCVDDFYKQMETYQRITSDIQRKAKLAISNKI